MAKAKKAVAKSAKNEDKENVVPSSDSQQSSGKDASRESVSPVVEFTRRSKTPTPKKPRSLSKKSGLLMPVYDIHKKLKKGNYAEKVQKGAAVYLSAVIEYLVAEVLELSGNATSDNKKKRINPRFVTIGVQNDDELSLLWKNVVIPQGGVMPHIHEALLPKKSRKRSSVSTPGSPEPQAPKKPAKSKKQATAAMEED